jgi:hypothetical protein
MKSPWRIIGKLFPGRSGPQVVQDPVDNDAARSAALAQEAPTETQSSQIPANPFVEPPAFETDVETAKAQKAGGDISEPVSIADDPVKTVPATKSQSVHARKGSKPIVGDAKSKIAEVSSRRETQVSRATSTPVPKKARISADNRTQLIRPLDTFEAEVIDVDADVRALARQLAEKLRQQNVQLRGMLERFEEE